jgi:sulfur relay (sulfurtransferase) complex TusBCD TusD component (DsrE family)
MLGVIVADAARLDDALALLRTVSGEARLFLMDDGVRAAVDPRLRALVDDGLDAALCAMDAEARGVVEEDGGVRFGSQYDHAVLVRDATRLVAWTGHAGDPVDVRPLPRTPRRVRVVVESPLRAWQGLRAAAGYLAVDLAVEVALAPTVAAALVDAAADEVADPVGRAGRRALRMFLATNRIVGFGREPADVELRW